jgi:hypothetical protein
VKTKSGELYGMTLLALCGDTIWGGAAWLLVAILTRD